MIHEEISSCRSCASGNISPVLSLGETPLADRLLRQEDLGSEHRVPLTVLFCHDCSLLQIRETVPPDVLFVDDYPYYSSRGAAELLEHSKENAEDLIGKRRLDADCLVVELASNDGYLLRNFVSAKIPVLGIDPARGPAAAAREIGVETINDFFTEQLAKELASEGKRADVVIANNVLAHVADLNGFVRGIRLLLKDEGVAVIEVPYLVDLMQKCEFDTIYHQHLCYFSVTALDKLFERHDLCLQDIKRLPIHGGSLRLYVGRDGTKSVTVRSLLAEELKSGLTTEAYYSEFSAKVEDVKSKLVELLRELKNSKKTIVGYGAAAKATTLLSYCGIDSRYLEYLVDRNEYKHGRFMGGSHLPIAPAERLVDEQPDYCLILAWNFSREIVAQQDAYRQRGGKFIVPIPSPRVLN